MVNDAETCRPVGEIIGDLKDLEKEAETVESDLKEMLAKIGIDY